MTDERLAVIVVYNVCQRPACGTVIETESWRPPVAGLIGRVDGLLPSGDIFTVWIAVALEDTLCSAHSANPTTSNSHTCAATPTARSA